MHDKDRAVDDNQPGPTMLADVMAAAAAYAVQRGVSLHDIARAGGLAPQTLVAAPERVAEDSASRILELLAERFPGEAVGLETGAAASLQFLGPLGPIARLVPDMRAGIEMFVSFQSVVSTSFVLEFVEEPPGPMLRFEHPNDQTFGPHGAEMALVMGARACTEVLGIRNAIRMVWLGHGPTAHLDRYTEIFGAPVRCGAPFAALHLHAERLDDPVDPHAGARLRVLRAQLELVRAQLEQQRDPVELRRIRDAAAYNAAQGEYGAPALARRLGMSVRTLQRRIGALGTSVRELVDDVRSATARQMLSDPDLGLVQVADALGYSTESAFRRAFRRWTGQSPAQYRRALTTG